MKISQELSIFIRISRHCDNIKDLAHLYEIARQILTSNDEKEIITQIIIKK